MNNNSRLIVTIFSLLLTVSLSAQGPPGGGRGQGQGGSRGQQRGGGPNASDILSKLDTNNDDKISLQEASKDKRGKISEDFDIIDSNEDSFIDLEELKNSLRNSSSKRKPKKVAPKKLIKEVDDNGDGTLNALEVAAKDKQELSKNFQKIDINNDNELDLEELKAFFSKNDKGDIKRKKGE